MILTIGYRGVFRQAEYETVAIEGSVTIDEEKDPDYFAPGGDMPVMLRSELLRIVGSLIRTAADTSRYGPDETVVYEWEGLTNATSSPAEDGTPKRRVRRRPA